MLVAAFIVGLLVSLIIVKRLRKSTFSKTSAKAYTIGILQTASHPALDAARDGFMEELQHKLGDSVEFIVQNAQGSIANAHALAQQFHANQQFNGFFAIATPAAQALSSLEKNRPVIIAAVTDPSALGLTHVLNTNVCGTTDMIDVNAEIEMLTQLVPQAKNIGIIYTAGEVNSIALVKQMHQEVAARGLTATDFAIGSEADLHAIIELACRKTDLLLAPTDNTVASTIAAIAAITAKHKKPLIVSDNMLVKCGALAARGVDYKATGKQAAEIAYKVLVEGQKPEELPIAEPKIETVYINKNVLDALGLTIPDILKKQSILYQPAIII